MIKKILSIYLKLVLHKNIYYTILIVPFLLLGCGVRKNASLPHISNHLLTREFSNLPQAHIDSLKSLYGTSKIFVDEYIEPTLIALSFFPELKNVEIEFRYSKENTTMAARPITSSLFYKRKYIILINNKKEFNGILLKDVPFNAKIGVLGHELSHIADYEKLNFFGILGVAFRYLDEGRKPLFEKEVDKATIERGLGWQLYDWSVFSMHTNETATEKYKEFKRKTYMSPDEIKHKILSFSKYSFHEE